MYQPLFRHLAALLLCGACFLPSQTQAAHPPAPLTEIAVAAGSWQGKLLYNDYSSPGKMVTLPTQLHVALSNPNTLVLYFIYDDGLGKTVYGYEQIHIDQTGKRLQWQSSGDNNKTTDYQLTGVSQDAKGSHFTFSRPEQAMTIHYQMTISPTRFSLEKSEFTGTTAPVFRHRYQFDRVLP